MQKEGKKQLLVIEPKNEIAFKGPYEQVVTEYFTLKNPTESTIAFKVKTTAPKRYCVRPNNGLVSPHQTVQVAVMLQPGDLAQEKHKHKFMIQSVIVPNNNNQTNVDELFKSASPDEIMDSKFKCVFLDGIAGAPLNSSSATQLMSSTQNSNQNSAMAQKYDKNQQLDDHQDGMVGDGMVSNGSGSNVTDFMSSSSGVSSTININHHHHNDNLDDASSLTSAVSNNGHYDTEDFANALTTKITAGANVMKNKKLNSATSSSKRSDFDRSATNSNYESTGVSSSNQDKNDVESLLKSAQEEIRMLKDKLQQVQRYASKLSSSTSSATTATSETDQNNANNKQIAGFLPNNQQLFQLAAIGVLIAFLVGIFFGKTLF